MEDATQKAIDSLRDTVKELAEAVHELIADNKKLRAEVKAKKNTSK